MNKPKSRQLALGILMVLSSILVLVAMWDIPDGSPAPAARKGASTGPN
jgi:hypothetical protein